MPGEPWRDPAPHRGRLGAGLARREILFVAASVLVAAPCVGVGPAHAQDPPADSVPSFTFRGNVVDYLTEAPIEGALVQIAELGRSAETDANGYFDFPALVPDRYTIVTASLGYETNREPSDIPFGAIMVVRLSPMAIELEGLAVEIERVVRQIEIRRLATPTPSSACETDILERSVDLDVVEFVSDRTSLEIIEDSFGLPVARFRNRISRLRVCLDEYPVGAGFLQNLQPDQLGLVEVFESLRMVRMYTKEYLEHAAERGFQLQPINITTGRGC